MYIPSYVSELTDKLQCDGYEAYVVGGCVRDSIMGKHPDDYDVATNATPDEIKACFNGYKTILTGEKHGTVCVVSHGKNVEITTFRTDGEYIDGRHPENVSFTSELKSDLQRRDFTMNAVSYSPKDGYIDYFGGISDINKGIIKTVGNPADRFCEDALRIMRCIRFASQLGFEIEEDVKEAIHRMKDSLLKVSAERLFAEFVKLLCGHNVREILCEFDDVIKIIAPEITKSIGFNQNNKHHMYDVYTHSAVVTSMVENDPVLRLAAFYHDCGKPYCYSEDEMGQGHFYGHSKISAELAYKSLEGFKASNQIKNQVCMLIEYHQREILPDAKSVKRFLSKVTPEFARMLFKLKRADCLGLSEKYHTRISQIDDLEVLTDEIIKSGENISLNTLAINGGDLMELGFGEGRIIGKLKQELLNAVIEGKVSNTKEELLVYLKANLCN